MTSAGTRFGKFQETVHDVLLRALAEGATDIHFHSGSNPMIRKNGNLVPFTSFVLLNIDLKEFIIRSIRKDQADRFLNGISIDFDYKPFRSKEGFLCRAYTLHGEIALSVIPVSPPAGALMELSLLMYK